MSLDINIPGYEITALLGKGGMSNVYLARQLSLEREVAIKVLETGLDNTLDFEKRFMREAKSLAKLIHPNILTIYDVGIHDKRHYIATEFIPGGSLDLRIKQGLDPEHAISIAMAIAQALSYAHSSHFVHRDIKPSNILFRSDGTPVLVDFGIARNTVSQEANATQFGTVIGTPSYMSPEQALGEEIDHRSDLYSLGVVLYRMLTGKLPYSGGAVDIVVKHINEPIPTLPSALGVFQPVINGLLAKSPDERISNADTLVDMLDQLANEFSGKSGQYHDTMDSVPARSTPSSLSPPTSAPGLTGWSLGRLFSWLTPSRSSGATQKPAQHSSPLPPMGGDESGREQRNYLPTDSSGQWPQDDMDASRTRIVKVDEDLLQGGRGTESAEAEPPFEKTCVFQARGSATGNIPVALTIVDSPVPDLEGSRIDISRTPFVIGRGSEADLCIPDIVLSRAHFSIEYTENGFHIIDSSTNGVFVNGRKLTANTPEPLLFGDAILLSKDTSLKFNARIEALPDLTGTLFANRYQLTKQIHSSIKASTYNAEDKQLPRAVAIKIFSPSLEKIPHYARIFRQQAEIAAQLAHPYIARVLDMGAATVNYQEWQGEVQYLCMEQMPAGNLSEKAISGSPLDLRQVLEWLTKIVDALSYAHTAGFVHSGLKPSAIVFDNQDNPYVADFALASQSGTEAGTAILGSAAFIAPEQWENDPLTPAVDQYSLAVLTYMMLSGSLPFEGQGNPEVRKRNYLRPAIPIHEEAARNGMDQLPAALAQVLNKALSVAPAERYESVGLFLNALVDAAAGKRKSGKPRVFISYHRETSAGWAVLFERELKENYGIDTYVDTQAIDQAARFPERLSKAIENCDVVICLLGEKTLESEWVREEIRIANECEKPMVPVFQECFDWRLNDDNLPAYLHSLLKFDGVHLLDKRNIHVDHSIGDVARIVKNTINVTR